MAMNIMRFPLSTFLCKGLRKGLPVTAAALLTVVPGAFVSAHAAVDHTPALTVSDSALPPELARQLYVRTFTPTTISPQDIVDDNYFAPTDTVVGEKVEVLRADLFSLQKNIAGFSERLSLLEDSVRNQAATYHASVATINTRLQVGTTPGNPRLVTHLNKAQQGLDDLSGSLNQLNDLAIDVSEAASLASFLLGGTQATYSLTGAVEEDHIHLAQLEEALNNTTMTISRLLNNINDQITRTSTYLRSEQANVRALATAVRTGDPMGRSLANLPFSGVQRSYFAIETAPAMMMSAQPQPVSAPALPAPITAQPMPEETFSATTAPVPTQTAPAQAAPTFAAPMPVASEVASLPRPASSYDDHTPSSLRPGAVSSAAALPAADSMPVAMAAPVMQQPERPAAPRPLVKIRFDHSNVDYEQPVYMAVNEALTRYPSAQFELVAVHPESPNAAKQAIESTRARRHAEEVLRSLNEMGLPLERINLSYTPSPTAQSSEVHLYIR